MGEGDSGRKFSYALQGSLMVAYQPTSLLTNAISFLGQWRAMGGFFFALGN